MSRIPTSLSLLSGGSFRRTACRVAVGCDAILAAAGDALGPLLFRRPWFVELLVGFDARPGLVVTGLLDKRLFDRLGLIRGLWFFGHVAPKVGRRAAGGL